MGDWSGFQDRIQSLAELAINGRGFIRFGRLRGFFDGGRIGQTSLDVLALPGSFYWDFPSPSFGWGGKNPLLDGGFECEFWP